jgi:hypothetical protein
MTRPGLEPLFFTFILSAAATSPSTCVLGLVAAALTTKVKNEGLSPGRVIYTRTTPFRSAYVMALTSRVTRYRP